MSQMYAGFWCVVMAVIASAVADSTYRLTISPEIEVTGDLGSTVTLSCTASRTNFWLASDSVVWTKKQGNENVTVTSNSPTYSAALPFAPRYEAAAVQLVADTVTYELIIHDFRHEDSGTYSCALVGIYGAGQAASQQVTLYSGLTATVNLTSTASLEGDVYVYSYTRLEQTTTCEGFFYGTGSPQMQISYSGNEVTNDFQQFSTSYLEGETIGLKKRVQRLTYNASIYFYPSSDVSSPLLCKALNDRGVSLNASSINVRSRDKPTLECNKQDPQVVKSNDTDIRIMCSLGRYTWEENVSAILWTFTVTMADGQSKSVTLTNGQSGYNRQALNDQYSPQFNIDSADKDALTYTDYYIALTHNGMTVASTRYKLQTDASSAKGQMTGSGSRSVGAVLYVAFTGVLAFFTSF